jgi:hypothetical protein
LFYFEILTQDAKWKPDGGYIPRVIFYDGVHGEVTSSLWIIGIQANVTWVSHVQVLEDAVHEGGNPQYKYYHSGPVRINPAVEKREITGNGTLMN